MSRSRGFTFTIFDHNLETALQLLGFKYLVYGRELCPTTLREHLQGYIFFQNARALKTIKKKLPGAHIEIAKGPPSANYAYCTKDGDYEEYGTRPLDQKEKGLAEKDRWREARLAAQEGRLDDVPDDIFIRQYRAIKAIQKDYMVAPPDAEEVTGVWIWGPAGVGKSRYAREKYPNSYFKMANKWWDGYQGEETVIIDDIDVNHACLGYHFKIWGDRYAFRAETKGGALMLRPKKIVITSQFPPEAIWQDAETLSAVRRRYNVIHMDTLFPTHKVWA